MLILVLRPPRERLIFASPFWAPAARWLVRSHNGGIDDQVFQVRISASSVKSRCQTSFFCSPPETFEHAVPVAKLNGKLVDLSSRFIQDAINPDQG
jgi:hypothetical protein